MPDAQPSHLSEVLAEEYQALRSGSSYAPSDPVGSEPAKLAELYRTVHQQPKPFSALCISGGGIRSATFALGALQSMADHGFLTEFDYLSTVSGGGYIGSWLTAWIQRAGGLDQVAPKLKRNAPKPLPPAPDPIQHLRDYNNYLTPKMGLFSADTWTIVAIVIRNMILNWLVLVPLLLFALAIPRLMVSLVVVGSPDGDLTAQWVTNITLFLTFALFAVAIFNAMRYLPGVGNVRHTQGEFLWHVLAPLVISYALRCTYYWWVRSNRDLTIGAELLWGLIACAAGWVAYLLICVGFRDPKLLFYTFFGPITIAVILLGVSVGVSSWLLLDQLYSWEWVGLSHFVALGLPAMLLGFALAGTLFIGLTSRVLKDEDREWFSRAGAWLTLFILFWAGISSLVLLAPKYLLMPAYTSSARGWIQSGLAILGALSGWATAAGGFSSKSKARKDEHVPEEQSWHIKLAVNLAPPIFAVLFFIALSLFTNMVLSGTGLVKTGWWNYNDLVEATPLLAAALVGGVFLTISFISAYYININFFSISAMYRDRLIRAYLGASNPKRNASLFTGFAENDNMRMREINTSYKPFHVLNLTLNLVAGERLAWQQRKAASFTVSPLHSGSADLGYRPSAEYADGIMLGTAMAISGAAASPNMGYHSSPVVGFIMTLFNARLGGWLGNPGLPGEKTWKFRGPRSATGSLIKEAFGLTTNRSKYVYLSDGGHFENLGLYEMVARRCKYIVVLDSGADPCFGYEDLGNALRKIRIDMNIPIEFGEALAGPLRARTKRCAVARIDYSAVDGDCEPGYLVYVKPIFLGNEPPDVQSYHTNNELFPHETTADQWFNESQTESYRMLGLHTMDEVCGSLSGTDPDDVRKAAEDYIRPSAASTPPQSTAQKA
jgi:hypothetical protein